MFSGARKHFNASTVIAIVALVFAMTGGAFAVTSKGGGPNATIAAKKKGKSKVLRGPAGPRGPEGKQGPAGAAGPAGPAGAKGETGPQGSAGPEGKEGKEGKAGTNGTNGKNGLNGKSVTVASEPAGANCKEGGSSFEEQGSGTKTYACNGSPWTAGGTLPAGAVETGVWQIAAVPIKVITPSNFMAVDPVSFNVPLATPITESEKKVHIIAANAPLPSGCTGSLAKPGAAPHNLCIFEAETKINVGSIDVQAPGIEELEAANTTGMVIRVHPETGKETEKVFVYGTWAVAG